jgi:saccharopine dehydrogenase-like NADP-dependent oxidoreductase
VSTTQQPSPPPLARPQGRPSRPRVTIAGGGRIGTAIAALLGPTGDYDLTIVDRVAPHTTARTVIADVGDPETLSAALAGSDIVVNALPFHLTTTCLDSALAVGADYVDLTEDVAASRTVRAKAAASGVTVVAQCGLAPGFVSVAANGLAERFDRVRDLSLRVGALPRSPSNALGYNLTWSTEGVVNEYIEPCQAIVGGRLVEVPPLESLETIGVDGVRYEAFNTSGGLGTLCETWLGRCERLDYKSVRHPGHAGIMKVLLHDLRLADHRDELHALLERALPTTDDDMVVISVSVTGWREGRLTEDMFARTIHAQRSGGLDLSAIQSTTAASACTVVDLIAGGLLPHTGVVRQEEIPLDTFLANRFGQVYDTGMLLTPMAAVS